jgi:two-component system sensor histidine kinase YesM
VTSNRWRLIETAPMDFVEEQRTALLISSLAILVGVGLAGLALATYIARRVTRPLERLLNNVDQISQGKFDVEIRVRGEDEIGRLGSGINRMQSEIENLLNQAIQREQNLKRAEIAALQAQINPHFIYNTLNTVRIMADLQNAAGISHVVQALGRMLRLALSSRSDKVTVEEELRFLEDYFYILRVRYKGAINLIVEAQDERLLKCRMLKFILQPLIENAVLHGIEPHGVSGTIAVSFAAAGDRLQIRVRDDGVGIEPDRLAHLLDARDQAEPGASATQVSTGLGINNIHRRIKMVYGDGYGLSYESEPGQYTCVTITLPRED